MEHGNYKAPQRFHSLDVLRGVAALGAVFWHWQHFFFTGTIRGTIDWSKLPLSDWISFLYQRGWLAVDLFFSLSGFVFYWLYARKVAEGAITPGKFALLRFSRLYPLHFATLLIVATGQIFYLLSPASNSSTSAGDHFNHWVRGFDEILRSNWTRHRFFFWGADASFWHTNAPLIRTT